jgi:hypothetical protein
MPDSLQNEQSEQSSAASNVSLFASDAQRLLEEMKLVKSDAEACLKEIQSIGKNAGSEGLLAFNAKKACEEHATAIANTKGSAEADANTIATNKQRSDEIVAALNTGKATVDADMKAIDTRRKEVDQSATNIVKAAETGVTRLTEIETLKDSAETTLTSVAESAKAASEAASKAGTAQKEAKGSSDDAAALTATIAEQHKTTSENVAKTEALLKQAQVGEANVKAILDHLSKSDEIATGHEKRVEALTQELQRLVDKVEGLLPGATSAGLASSFNKQRSRFERPQRQWLLTFAVCICGLVLVALPNFLSTIGWLSHPADQSLTSALRNLILRLPIAAPVLWLAIYAGRNYMMSLRMEEDYAYKEAISTAFEGYKREMEKITGDENQNPTPLTILCTNVLRAIAERPGRIYEGKQRDLNVVGEIRDLAEKGAELSKKQLAAQ